MTNDKTALDALERIEKYDRPELLVKELRAKAALIDDRNKGGQLKDITDDMRKTAFRLERWMNTHPQPSGDAVKALDRVLKSYGHEIEYLEGIKRTQFGDDMLRTYKKFIKELELVKAALTQPPKADVEAIKIEVYKKLYPEFKYRQEHNPMVSLNDCINYIAAQGYIGGGEYEPIFSELKKAVTKFPTWPTDPLHALAVLGEEYGELTKETLQLTYEPHKTTKEAFKKEALQTAAMALRFYLSLDLYEFKQGEQHAQKAAPKKEGVR